MLHCAVPVSMPWPASRRGAQRRLAPAVVRVLAAAGWRLGKLGLWGLVASTTTALALAAPPSSPASPAPLPALGLAAGGTTVSGLSSGGYMAGQFHVAYSGSLAGAAILAGGPYGCSRGMLSTAMTACACPPASSPWQAMLQKLPFAGCAVPAPSALAAFAESALTVNRPYLDDTANLARQRVWLFSGGRDTVVPPALVDATEAFYRRMGVGADRMHHERVAAAAHGLPAPDAPVACGTTASPFLTRCNGEDAAGELLAWLYAAPGQPAFVPGTARPEGMRRFDQKPYRQAGVFDGLDDSGWLYVPRACEGAGGRGCRLHVVFHGCAQAQGFVGPDKKPIGRRFVDGAGYNRWAEAQRIVVLYPQVKPSTLPAAAVLAGATYRLNPEACWDFWGYTDRDGALLGAQRRFARRSAPQLHAVKAMADALLATPP